MKLGRFIIILSVLGLLTLGSFTVTYQTVEPITIEKETCQEDLMVTSKSGRKNIYNITIVRIGLSKVYYKKCNSDQVIWIKKDDILAVKYADGKMDKFDFNGVTNKKKGKWKIRSKKSVIERRNQAKKK